MTTAMKTLLSFWTIATAAPSPNSQPTLPFNRHHWILSSTRNKNIDKSRCRSSNGANNTSASYSSSRFWNCKIGLCTSTKTASNIPNKLHRSRITTPLIVVTCATVLLPLSPSIGALARSVARYHPERRTSTEASATATTAAAAISTTLLKTTPTNCTC